MLNMISLAIGLVGLCLALLGIIPIVSLVNWIAFPIAVFGAAVGMLSGRTSGRNLNLFVGLISGLRLYLTGGLF